MAVKEVEHLTSIIRVKVNVKSSISGGGGAAERSSRSLGGGAAAAWGSSEISGCRACGVAYTTVVTVVLVPTRTRKVRIKNKPT